MTTKDVPKTYLKRKGVPLVFASILPSIFFGKLLRRMGRTRKKAETTKQATVSPRKAAKRAHMTVANVNKGGKQIPAENALQARQTCNKALKQEPTPGTLAIDNQPKGAKRARKGEVDSDQMNNFCNERDGATTPEVTFNEETELICMQVEDGDESFGPSDYDDQSVYEDQEVSFRNSQSSRSGTDYDKCLQQDRPGNDSDTDLEENESVDGEETNEQLSSEQRRKKLQEIDLKMQRNLKELHELMEAGGLHGAAQLTQETFELSKKSAGKNTNTNASFKRTSNSQNAAKISSSEDTVYTRAVPKRISSSSDEPVDTSDENLEVEFDKLQSVQGPSIVGEYEPPVAERASRQSRSPRPSTSGDQGLDYQPGQVQMDRQVYVSPDDKANDMIRDAEQSKAQIFATPGKHTTYLKNLATSATLIDEGFVMVGAHLDELTLWKIQKGDYVDFCKLIPHDRVLTEDEQKLEIVI